MYLKRQTETAVQVPFYYGWVIVCISALGIYFSGPGQTFSNSVFIDAYIIVGLFPFSHIRNGNMFNS